MGHLDTNLLKKMYELVYTIRQFELTAIEQYRLGNIRGYFHPYLGEEAIAVGTILALEADDYIVSTHRGHGHAIAKGHDVKLMMAEIFGKATGYCKGRGGSMHVANLALHNLGANGIVGGGIPLATGAAMGIKQKGASGVVLSFFSDGAANNGVFHESVNMAAIFKLPVVYVLENNHYAVSTSVEYSTLVKALSCRAVGYGIPGISEDGNDAVEVYETMKEPIERARMGEGPTLVEFKTYRHGGHHVNDPGLYMPKDKLEGWKKRDPVDILRKHLIDRGIDEADIDKVNGKVGALIEAAIRFAIESPGPSVEEFIAEIKEE
jgi:TPP-dependent pyruvate/acetoin dehydrogenase alpha subunit